MLKYIKAILQLIPSLQLLTSTKTDIRCSKKQCTQGWVFNDDFRYREVIVRRAKTAKIPSVNKKIDGKH